MNLKYLLGSIFFAPALPLMYLQGKRIKKSVPKLPEAKGLEGLSQFKKSAPTIKMLAIGESTIAGVGVDTHEEGFTGTIASELSRRLEVNISWKVYARTGYTAKRVTEKIIPKITENEADLVIVGLGGNDAFTLNSPSKWRADLKKLIETLQSKFPNVYLLFPCMPPIKEFPAFTSLIKLTIGSLVELLGDELASLCQEYDQVFYHNRILTIKGWNALFQMEASPKDFFSDGVHPSKLAYQSWAKDMAQEVCNNQEIVEFIKGKTDS